MPYSSGLKKAIWKTRFFLLCLACCVIGALAGIQRGFACANIFGMGSCISLNIVDTCADGADCVVVECDATSYGGGLNCGQFCLHNVAEECMNVSDAEERQ